MHCFLRATPHKARLTALHAICVQIFRHIAQKSLAIRQYACGISRQSAEKSDNAPYAQALCGVALKHYAKDFTENPSTSFAGSPPLKGRLIIKSLPEQTSSRRLFGDFFVRTEKHPAGEKQGVGKSMRTTPRFAWCRR